MARPSETPSPTTTVPANSRYTPPQPKDKGRGLWGNIAHYTGAQAVADFLTPEAVENVVGSVTGTAYSLAKSFSQGYTSVYGSIPQAIQNEIFAVSNLLPSGHSFKTNHNKSIFDQFVRGPLYEETTFGQSVNQALKAIGSDKPVDWRDVAGTGFFYGGEIEKARAAAAGEYRPKLGPQQQTMTLGRAAGTVLNDLGVVQQGSVAYNIISGAIDAAAAIKFDPNFKRGKAPFGSTSEAASAIADSDALRVAAGLIEGQNPSVSPNIWNAFKQTPQAVKTLEPFVEENNPAKVWRLLKRQAILTADEIAFAKDHQGVIKAMDNAVENLDPAVNIRNIPAGKFSSIEDAGYTIKQSAQRFTRLFEVMPESLFIPKNDVEVAARRVDDLMGYLGFSMDQRDQWINRLIATHKQGTSEAFFNYFSDWEKDLLKVKLVANGVPESEVGRLTQWRQYTVDHVARTTLQDLIDNTPAAWMEKGNIGIVRNTQLLQDGAYLVDPTILDEVVSKLGKVYKLEQEAQNLPARVTGDTAKKLAGIVGPVTSKAIRGTEILGDAYGWYQSRLWKPISVAAGRYLTRVLPDEQMRVLLNGTFEHPGHYVAAMLDGRFAAKLGHDGMYTADVFGDMMNKTILLGNLKNEVAETRTLLQEIDRLKGLGRFDEADNLFNQNIDQINNLDNAISTMERTEKIINDKLPSLNEALIGGVPDSAKRKLMGMYSDGAAMRTKAVDIVSRNVERERRFWVKGVVQEVADLHNNPHIRRIANGGLFDSDTLFVNNQFITWAQYKASGLPALSADEAIASWLFNGGGRQYFERYFTNFAGLDPNFNWNSPAGAREFVRVLNNEVKSVAGTNKDILETIVTGSFNNTSAFTKLPTGVVEGAEDFEKYVAEKFAADPGAPTHMRFRPTGRASAATVGSKAAAGWDYVLDMFFRGAYGMASDKLSRSPAFRAAYWGRVEEVASLASKEAADQLLENLDKANLPKSQTTRIKRLLSIANGKNDLEAIDGSARAYGLKYERDLLFDATKKSYAGDHYKFVFPFFEAYREQGSTWLKLLIERPQNAHKIDVIMRGLREADGVGLGDYNGDGKKDGFIYRDPQSGEDMVAIPGSSSLGRWFSGVPTGGISLPTSGLTMFGNVLPGIGPVVNFPLQYFIPKDKNWQSINNVFFPYGRPDETGAQAGGGFFELAAPRPTWLKRVSPYLSDLAKKTPIVGGTLGEAVGSIINQIGGNEKETQVYKSYYANTLKALASTSPIPKTQKEAEQFLEEVEDKTNKLYFLRGLGNFVLPGTPVTKFMADTKSGPIELGILADTLRQYEKEAEANGEDRNVGAMRFIDMYGSTTWGVFSSVRKSDKYEGLVMSKDFEDWFDNNQTLIKTYPQVASYFGPQTESTKFGPTEQAVYNRFISRGAISAQSGTDMIAQAQTNIAYTVYETMRSKMSVAQQNSQQGQAVLRSIREVLKEQFPKWDTGLIGQQSKSKRDEQMRQLVEIVKEPSIAKTEVGKAVGAYLAFRDQKIKELKDQGVIGWQKGARSVSQRQQLMAVGETMASKLPGFVNIWERVLSREFEPPEVQE